MEDVSKHSGGEDDVAPDSNVKTVISSSVPDGNCETHVTSSDTSHGMSTKDETAHTTKMADESLTEANEGSVSGVGANKISSVDSGGCVDISLKYRDSSFSCETCGMSTAGSKGFDEHIAKHILGKPYVCLNCMMEFETKSEAVKHAAKDHPDQQFKCAIKGVKKINKIISTLIQQGSYTFKGRAKSLQKNSAVVTSSSPACSDSSQSCQRKTSMSPDCSSSVADNSTVSEKKCNSPSCSVSSASATSQRDVACDEAMSSTTSENENASSSNVKSSMVSNSSSPVAPFINSDSNSTEVAPQEMSAMSSLVGLSGPENFTVSTGAGISVISDKRKQEEAKGEEACQSTKTESDDNGARTFDSPREIKTNVSESTQHLHIVPQTSLTPSLHEEKRWDADMSVTSGETSPGKTQTNDNQAGAQSTTPEKDSENELEGKSSKHKVKNLIISPQISRKLKQVFKERDQRKENPPDLDLIDLTEDDHDEDQNSKTTVCPAVTNNAQKCDHLEPKQLFGKQNPLVSGSGNVVVSQVSNVNSDHINMKNENKIARDSSLKTLKETSTLQHRSEKSKESAVKKKRVFTKVGTSYLCNICKTETEQSEKFEEHVWIHLHVKRKICKKCSIADCLKGKTNCQIINNIMAGLKFGSVSKSTSQKVKSEDVVIISDDEDDDIVCVTDKTKPASSITDVRTQHGNSFSNSGVTADVSSLSEPPGVPSIISQGPSTTIQTQVQCATNQKFSDRGREQLECFNNRSLNQYSTFVCSVVGCNYHGNIFQKFIEHLQSFHRYASSFSCFFCKKICRSIEEMAHHCKVNLKKVIQCPHCPTVAADRNGLLGHIQTTHPGMSKQIKVSNQLVCHYDNIPKQQVSESGISVEETNSKFYKSTVTASKSAIKRPYSIPAGENYPRPVSCSECPFTTKTRSQLIIHITNHSTLFPKFEEEELNTERDGISKNITESNVETVGEDGGNTESGQQSLSKSQEKLGRMETAAWDFGKDEVELECVPCTSDVQKEDGSMIGGMSGFTGSESSENSLQRKRNDSEAVYIGSDYMHDMLVCFFERVSSTDNFVCKICKSSIKSKYQIHKHVLKHFNVWLYKCGYCNYKVLESSKLHQHIHKSHGTIPFKRMKIGTAKLKSVLQKRAQKLTSKCETETSSNNISDGSDKESENSHIDEMDCCDDSAEVTKKVTKKSLPTQKKASLGKNSDLVMQVSKPTVIKNGDLFKCSVCSYTSRSQFVVAGHLKLHRNKKSENFQNDEKDCCDDSAEVTEKVTKKSSSIQKKASRGKHNAMIMQVSKPTVIKNGDLFKCSVCSYTSRSQFVVAGHLKLHRNKKSENSKMDETDCCDNSAEVTEKVTKKSSSIQKKASFGKNKLIMHFSKSTVIKSGNLFKCCVCSYTSRNRSVVAGHLKLHRNQKVACSLCSFRTCSEANVKRHIKEVHGKSNDNLTSVNTRSHRSGHIILSGVSTGQTQGHESSSTKSSVQSRKNDDLKTKGANKTQEEPSESQFDYPAARIWINSKIRTSDKLHKCSFCGQNFVYKGNARKHIISICLKKRGPKAMFDKYLSKVGDSAKEGNMAREKIKIDSDEWALQNIKKTGEFSICGLCNYKSASIWNVKRHVLTIHEESDFHSGKSSIKYQTLNSYQSKIKAKKQKFIKMAGYSTTTRRQRDMLLKQNKNPTTSCVPDYLTSAEGQRWVISKIRRVGKFFRCGFCNHKSLYKRNIKSHIATLHSEHYKVKKNPKQPTVAINNKPINSGKDTDATALSESSETRLQRKLIYKCHGCKKSFPTEKIVNEHYQKNSCKTMFRCPLCRSFFSLQSQAVKKHSIIVHGEKTTPAVCTGNERYRRFDVNSAKKRSAIDNLQDHPSKAVTTDSTGSVGSSVLNYSKRNMSRFYCVRCGFVAASIKAFQFHFSKEHASQILVCALCTEFTTNSFFHLRNHTRNKHVKALNLKFFIGPKTSEKSNSHSSRETENICYSAQKDLNTIVCKECNFVSTSADDFKKHHANGHEGMLLLCLNCDEFSDKSISCLIDHTKYAHRSSRLKFKYSSGETVGKTDKYDNAENVEKSCSRKLYHCVMPHCKFASPLRNRCKEHLFSHFNYSPYKCPYCSFKTQLKHCVGRHQARHHPGKAYSVTACKMPTDLAKMVSRLIEKSDHQNSEATPSSSDTESNNSTCTSKDVFKDRHCIMRKCDYVSSSMLSYRCHLFEHFKYRPYKCIHCSYVSSFCKKVDQHIRRDHPNTSQIGYKYLRKAVVEEKVENLMKTSTLSGDDETSVSIDGHYMKKISGNKRIFSCSKCPAKYLNMANMKYHLFHGHHLGVTNCLYCDGKSYTWSEMEIHIHNCHPSEEIQTIDLTSEEDPDDVQMEEEDIDSDKTDSGSSSTSRDLHPRKQSMTERVVSEPTQEASSQRGEPKSRKSLDLNKISKQRSKKFKGYRQCSSKEKAEKRPCLENSENSTPKRPKMLSKTDEEHLTEGWYSCHLCSYSSTDLHYLSRHLTSHGAFVNIVPGEKIALRDVLASENTPDCFYQCCYCKKLEDNLITVRKHTEENHPHQVVNCVRLKVGASCVRETSVNLQPRLFVEDICKMDLMRLATKLVQEGVRMKSQSESYSEAGNVENEEGVVKRKKRKISIFTKSKHMKFLDTSKDTALDMSTSATSGLDRVHCEHDGILDSGRFEGEQGMQMITELSKQMPFADTFSENPCSAVLSSSVDNDETDSSNCTGMDGSANMESKLNAVHKLSVLNEELDTGNAPGAEREFSLKDENLGILELSRVNKEKDESIAKARHESKANDECKDGIDENRDETNDEVAKTNAERMADDECNYGTDENKDKADDEVAKTNAERMANDECNYGTDDNKDEANDDSNEDTLAKSVDENIGSVGNNKADDENVVEPIEDIDNTKNENSGIVNDEVSDNGQDKTCDMAIDEKYKNITNSQSLGEGSDENNDIDAESNDNANNEINDKVKDGIGGKPNDDSKEIVDENSDKVFVEKVDKAIDEVSDIENDENSYEAKDESEGNADDENSDKPIDGKIDRTIDESSDIANDENKTVFGKIDKTSDGNNDIANSESSDATNNQNTGIANDESREVVNNEWKENADDKNSSNSDESRDIANNENREVANEDIDVANDESKENVDNENSMKAHNEKNYKANDESNDMANNKNNDVAVEESIDVAIDENKENADDENDDKAINGKSDKTNDESNGITKYEKTGVAVDENIDVSKENADDENSDKPIDGKIDRTIDESSDIANDENSDKTSDESNDIANNDLADDENSTNASDENSDIADDKNSCLANKENSDIANVGKSDTTNTGSKGNANDEKSGKANDENIANVGDENSNRMIDQINDGKSDISDDENDNNTNINNDVTVVLEMDESSELKHDENDAVAIEENTDINSDIADDEDSNKNDEKSDKANVKISDVAVDENKDKADDDNNDIANDETKELTNEVSAVAKDENIDNKNINNDMADDESNDRAVDETRELTNDENSAVAKDDENIDNININNDMADDESNDLVVDETRELTNDENNAVAKDENIDNININSDMAEDDNDIAVDEINAVAKDENIDNKNINNDMADDESNDLAVDETMELTNDETSAVAKDENIDNKNINNDMADDESNDLAVDETRELTNDENSAIEMDESDDNTNVNNYMSDNENGDISKEESSHMAIDENNENDENSDTK